MHDGDDGKAGTPSGSPSTKAPATAGASALFDPLQQQGDRVRDAAKWLLATLGTVAAILVAGLQFAAIGTVPSGWRAAAAIGGAAVAIVGVVVLIGLVLKVMLPSETTIDELAATDAPKKLRTYIARNKSLLQGYDSIQALAEDYRKALNETKRAMDYYHAQLKKSGKEEDPSVRKAEAEARIASARLSYLDKRVGYATKYLAVEQLQGHLGPSRQVVALLAAVAIGAGIGSYAWGTNAPKSAPRASVPAVLRGARLSDADLTRVALPHADLAGATLARASLAGADLSGADLTGANLKGARLVGARVDEVIWNDTTCPDGTNSDDHKNTCQGHLNAR